MSTQPQRAPLPIDFEELDFEIGEEHWNEYNLPDGTRIKGRIFLTKLIRDPSNPNNINISTSTPAWTVYANPPSRGERDNAPQPREYNTLPQHEVMPTSNNERFNIYHIQRNGQTIRIKLTVARIVRITDRFDNDGLPFYVINSGPIVILDPAPNTQQGQ